MKGGHHQHSNGAPDCPKARAAQGGVLGRQTQAFVLACADRRAPSVQPDPTVSLTTGSCDKNQLKHLNPVWFSHPAAAAWTVASERVLGAALACRGSHTAANTKRTCEVHGKPFLLSWSDTTGNRRVRHAHRTHTGLHAAAPNSSVRKHLSVCVCVRAQTTSISLSSSLVVRVKAASFMTFQSSLTTPFKLMILLRPTSPVGPVLTSNVLRDHRGLVPSTADPQNDSNWVQCLFKNSL